MAGRCGTVPPGAATPVSGQAGGGAVEVVVVGLTFLAASGLGEEEQALRRRPVTPVVTSTPQASGCCTLARLVSDLGIAGRRSYGGGARKWWHTRVAGRPDDGEPGGARAGAGQAEGVPAAVPAAAEAPV